MQLKATIVGNEETFRLLGIEMSREIKLETLIIQLKKQFEQEYYDTEDVGEEIIEGLESVRDNRLDRREWRKVLDEI
ncbi:MAG: hypothetical protein HQK79_21300 [Desulfobacterales bacterium]|nr:hypothetical protein [Desulfobacterales bacterium]